MSPFSAWDVEDMKDEELFRLLPKETRNAAIEAKIKLNSLIQHNEEMKLTEQKENAVLPSEKVVSEDTIDTIDVIDKVETIQINEQIEDSRENLADSEVVQEVIVKDSKPEV